MERSLRHLLQISEIERRDIIVIGDKQANAKIRKAMIDANISQGELAAILGVSEPALSIMLNVELSNAVQKHIMTQIKEAGG